MQTKIPACAERLTAVIHFLRKTAPRTIIRLRRSANYRIIDRSVDYNGEPRRLNASSHAFTKDADFSSHRWL